MNLFRFISSGFLTTFLFSFLLSEAQGEIIDRVVAIINKEVITLSELSQMAQLQSSEANPFLSPEQYRELLQGIIEQKLIQQEALQTEITVSERNIDQFIERFQKKNNLTRDQLMEALQQQGVSWDAYRTRVREEIRRSQIVSQKIYSQVNVTESEIEEYYQNHLDEYVKQPQVKIDQIFFPFSSGAPEEKERVMLQAETALERINSGESFQTIAQEYDPVREGDPLNLDYFKKGELMSALDDAAFSLEIGDVSDVIETDKGCFIIHILDRKEATITDLSEVRKTVHNQILQQKTEQKLREWLEELHNNAYIEIKI